MEVFISKDYRASKLENIQVQDNLSDCISFLESIDYISLDIETRNHLFPQYGPILLLQVGNKESQFLIDYATINIRPLKKVLEEKVLIMHNGKFDVKFLFDNNIFPNPDNLYDTFIAEKCIHKGNRKKEASLEACVKRYFNFQLQKQQRSQIIRKGIFNKDIIDYSIEDIIFLEDLMNLQIEKAKEKDIYEEVKLENKFVYPIAYIEYSGFKLDEQKWINKVKKEEKEFLRLENELTIMALSHELIEGTQLDMFNPETRSSINWSSSAQVIPIMEKVGVNTEIEEKGKIKKSIDSNKVLSKFLDVHPIVPLFISFKKMEKKITTYGYNFIDSLHSFKDGRLRTSFKQIVDTGRMSSGSKSDNLINKQNIPKGEDRMCFTPEEGNIFIVSDYDGQETRILAEFAKDDKYTDYVLNKDMHCFCTRLLYPELKDLSDKEIKEKHPQKRTRSKGVSFAIAYGGNEDTLKTNLSISLQHASYIFTNYMNYFSGLKKFFADAGKEALTNDYILIHPKTRGKTRTYIFDIYKKNKEIIENTPNFWDIYRKEKEEDSEEFNEVLKPLVSSFFRAKSEIERKAINYKIQGTAAYMTKLALYYVYQYILQNNLFNIVFVCNIVHDEIILECPKEMAPEISAMLKKSMEDAGKYFCSTIPLTASPVESMFWEH